MGDEQRVAAIAATQREEPDTSEPTLERQAELRAAYEANIAAGKPPYDKVTIRALGELKWILHERGWTGALGTVGQVRPDLRSAVLSNADLRDAYLDGARLHGVNRGGALLSDTDLREAHLEGADVREAYLTRANLRGTHLEDAYFGEAHLERADLDVAHLEGADLENAHLEGADLGDIPWSGVGAVNLTRLPWSGCLDWAMRAAWGCARP
jgi:hypothetical protein